MTVAWNYIGIIWLFRFKFSKINYVNSFEQYPRQHVLQSLKYLWNTFSVNTRSMPSRLILKIRSCLMITGCRSCNGKISVSSFVKNKKVYYTYYIATCLDIQNGRDITLNNFHSLLLKNITRLILDWEYIQTSYHIHHLWCSGCTWVRSLTKERGSSHEGFAVDVKITLIFICVDDW